VGTKLAQVLTQQGRRRGWLAAQTGVSNALVTRIAQGERRPSPEFRQRAAAALGVPEDELFPEVVQTTPA
jgi:transcriptional regulator with XRE-family HTH domain